MAFQLQFDNFGAQLLSCALDGHDIFYLSPLRLSPQTPARGGVPVVFPQFADRGPLPKHGFVRDHTWTLVTDQGGPGYRTIEFAADMDTMPSGWVHRALLRLEVAANEQECRITLRIENAGAEPFSFTGGLHPYFRVSNVSSLNLVGLGSQRVEDRYDPNLTHEAPTGPHFSAVAFERLYCEAPGIQLIDDARDLTLKAEGFTEWMVWNPGRDGAKALTDLPDEDWSKFICVEPVIVRKPFELAPGDVFTGRLTIRTGAP